MSLSYLLTLYEFVLFGFSIFGGNKIKKLFAWICLDFAFIILIFLFLSFFVQIYTNIDTQCTYYNIVFTLLYYVLIINGMRVLIIFFLLYFTTPDNENVNSILYFNLSVTRPLFYCDCIVSFQKTINQTKKQPNLFHRKIW